MKFSSVSPFAQPPPSGARHVPAEVPGDALARTHSCLRPENPLPLAPELESTYVKSQTRGSGRKASHQALRQLLALGISAAVVLKPALPPLLPAPSALRPAAIGSDGVHQRPGNQEEDWARSLSHQLGWELRE